jgi:hypothetical protein
MFSFEFCHSKKPLVRAVYLGTNHGLYVLDVFHLYDGEVLEVFMLSRT